MTAEPVVWDGMNEERRRGDRRAPVTWASDKAGTSLRPTGGWDKLGAGPPSDGEVLSALMGRLGWIKGMLEHNARIEPHTLPGWELACTMGAELIKAATDDAVRQLSGSE